jgi:pyruvate/2-oxoglutarate/acetoin dehydrogenase E1 component
VLDLRSLVPLDEEAILGSVRKTSKVLIVDEANETCAAGAQVAALIADRGFEDLGRARAAGWRRRTRRSRSRPRSSRRSCPASTASRRPP